MAGKQQLSLTQRQALRIIPMQTRMVEMLEMNPHEIEERVEQELDDNPALERSEDEDVMEESLNRTEDGDTFTESDRSISDYGGNADDETPYYNRRARNRSADDEYYEAPLVAEETLSDHLMTQLHEKEDLTPTQELIAEYIIGSLDNNGYLSRSVDAIAGDVTFNGGVEVEKEDVDEVLDMVRELDPPGIAAADVRQCLMLQLERSQATAVTQAAYDVLNLSFNDYSNHRYDRIMERHGLDRDMMEKVVDEVQSLNGRPAAAFAESRAESQRIQISPDFHVDVDRENGTLALTLLNRVPELQISQSFDVENNRILASSGAATAKRDNSATAFIRAKYNSAAEFIKILKMRQDTLFRTMRAIMLEQKDYFLTGDPAAIRPLRLQDIADIIGMDVSVVSRATSGKYVESIWGVRPLKFFFNERLTTAYGDDVSSRQVKEVIRHIVDSEDKRNPFNDDAILARLVEQGYNISRRTVAKYREQLGYGPSKLRKEF